jgi:hypothetical protein
LKGEKMKKDQLEFVCTMPSNGLKLLNVDSGEVSLPSEEVVGFMVHRYRPADDEEDLNPDFKVVAVTAENAISGLNDRAGSHAFLQSDGSILDPAAGSYQNLADFRAAVARDYAAKKVAR